MNSSNWQQRTARELNRLEEDTRLSAKGHYNAGAAWGLVHYVLGVPAAVLSASAAIATKLAPQATLPLALLASIFAALLTFVRASENASQHKRAGDEFLALNGVLRRARELSLASWTSPAEAMSRISELAAQKDDLNRAAPTIPWFAFVQARQGVATGEAEYKVDSK